jgi:hypothetical protein
LLDVTLSVFTFPLRRIIAKACPIRYICTKIEKMLRLSFICTPYKRPMAAVQAEHAFFQQASNPV